MGAKLRDAIAHGSDREQAGAGAPSRRGAGVASILILRRRAFAGCVSARRREGGSAQRAFRRSRRALPWARVKNGFTAAAAPAPRATARTALCTAAVFSRTMRRYSAG